jgi:urease accessory protein
LAQCVKSTLFPNRQRYSGAPNGQAVHRTLRIITPFNQRNAAMRKLVKKLDSPARLAGAVLKRAASFESRHGQLADGLGVLTLSDGSQVQLALPHHTHLAVGDILIDEQGMMVRVAGAIQPVIAVSGVSSGRLAELAVALTQGGWAVAFDADTLLTEPIADLEQWLKGQGFAVAAAQGRLDPPLMRAPARSHGHDHAHEHEHDHKHDHAHGHSHEGTHDHPEKHGDHHH